jgi:hypothetical protein
LSVFVGFCPCYLSVLTNPVLNLFLRQYNFLESEIFLRSTYGDTYSNFSICLSTNKLLLFNAMFKVLPAKAQILSRGNVPIFCDFGYSNYFMASCCSYLLPGTLESPKPALK